MASIQIPDGAHYVVMHCVPNGEATAVEATISDGLDATGALVLIEFGKADIAQKKQQAENEAGRRRLMTPVPLPVSAPVALPVPDASQPDTDRRETVRALNGGKPR